MKKQGLIFLLAAGAAGILSAANDSLIMTTDGREIKTSRIEIRDNEDLEYLSPDGREKNRIARGRYLYAQVPKPSSVTAADQKYHEQQWISAAALYKKAAEEYRLLGWAVYCTRMEAESLTRSGEKQQAMDLLRKLRDLRETNPNQTLERAKADNLLADLLIEAKEYDEAEKILNRQRLQNDPDLLFAAYFKSAVILQARNKKREAAMLFYQTALLFPKNARRAEALFDTWSLLYDLKDPAAGKIAEQLKREYPDSPYTKQLSF
ncbi:MAG: hypothetical protein IJS14_00175 [Lentisphaeria bacterium]|nr:hypothetical protein [Lentisphaeria bacterium]